MLSPQGTVRSEVGDQAPAVAPATDANPAVVQRIAIRSRVT